MFQSDLFGATELRPEGFRYQRDMITLDEERALVEEIKTLPLKEFQFQGFTGKRRTLSFGWRYDFDYMRLVRADDFPPFLIPLRQRAARFAQLDADRLQHALVIEYAPGAAIGWHRDKAAFDEVIGISLLSSCRFRFRREVDGKWQRAAVGAEPRSMYLLSGPARREWEHSIPAVEQLRFSITFRSFVADKP
jgi:alkylated DNA repair dioxygenase AlkB